MSKSSIINTPRPLCFEIMKSLQNDVHWPAFDNKWKVILVHAFHELYSVENHLPEAHVLPQAFPIGAGFLAMPP
jgi:hypothetical protein